MPASILSIFSQKIAYTNANMYAKNCDVMGTSGGLIQNIRHYPFDKRLYKVRYLSNKIISLTKIYIFRKRKERGMWYNWNLSILVEIDHFELMIMKKIKILNILPVVILPNFSQMFAHFIVSMHAKICVETGIIRV